jgi:hypothetical protein
VTQAAVFGGRSYIPVMSLRSVAPSSYTPPLTRDTSGGPVSYPVKRGSCTLQLSQQGWSRGDLRRRHDKDDLAKQDQLYDDACLPS